MSCCHVRLYLHKNDIGSSSEEEDEDDASLDKAAKSRAPVKRIKLDWESPDALKLRCSTSDFEQIAAKKAALCAHQCPRKKVILNVYYS
jgi:hypothetical protein